MNRSRASAKPIDLEEQHRGVKCSVPHCEQDGVTRFGYCRPHARMPYHVGKVLHVRPRPDTSRETESKVIAEVCLKREMVRFEGERGWHAPLALTLQSEPTPQEWLDTQEQRGRDGLYRARCGVCRGFGHFAATCSSRTASHVVQEAVDVRLPRILRSNLEPVREP